MMNNSTTQQTTFWKFISEHSIEIPIIQRDYAQGRKDKISLRKGFLGNLKSALDKTLPNDEQKLKLDFVYGSEENGKLQPLDGQQRLTTLWLLHWYIALRAGQLPNVAETLSHFTYETRVSSRDFCKQLCNPDNFKNCGLSTQVVPYITKQTWFFSAWKQDPTIQAMLTMLSGTPDTTKSGEDIIDGIEEAFNCNECKPGQTCKFIKYWELLISPDCPIIFYYLDLLGLKLSDDLYIKMNARGKQLTSFENFKADLIKYITEQANSSELDDETKGNWERLLNPEDGIPNKLDTTWMDIFWKNKSKDYKVDEIYFAFLNRFFWNELFDEIKESKSIENNAYYKYLNSDGIDGYSSFEQYKIHDGSIQICLFEKLVSLLDRYRQYSYQSSIPTCPWSEDFTFIPQYTDKGVSGITQPQRIVFYALCKYFCEGNTDDSEVSLERWLRVVWNLVSGKDASGQPEIRSVSAMQSAIIFISKLDGHHVYESLLQYDGELKDTAFDARCKEEITKARKIWDADKSEPSMFDAQKTWEDAIVEAESFPFFRGSIHHHAAYPRPEAAECFPFFRGSIRFLFQNANGGEDWDNYREKWKNAQDYFQEGKTAPIDLAKYCDDKQIITYWFKKDFSRSRWLDLLLDHGLTSPVHSFMMKEKYKGSELWNDINNILNHIQVDTIWLHEGNKDWYEQSHVITNYLSRTNAPTNGYVFVVGNRKRNQVIQSFESIPGVSLEFPQCWSDNFEVEDGDAVLPYYKGLYVVLMYNGFYFKYIGNNNDNNIYLCDQHGELIKKDSGEPCFFNVDNIKKEEFITHLDNLITQIDINTK